MKLILKKGDIVVRYIEDMMFTAKIVDINFTDEILTLQYLDDLNIEHNVNFNEIERISEKHKSIDHISSLNTNLKSNVETLQKPLLGLVEDDYEIRKNHKPTIFIHDHTESEETCPIILNGAENRLAAGAGLRALRYLKK